MVLNNKELIINNQIRLHEGMKISVMEKMKGQYSNIQKHEGKSGNTTFKIGPLLSNGFYVELNVHYLYEVYTYVSFSIKNRINSKGEAEVISNQTIYHENNRLVERLLKDTDYEVKIFNFHLKFVFATGIIISKYENTYTQPECRIRFCDLVTI